MSSVITHKLALALKLSDAIDGRNIKADLRFFVGGKASLPKPRPGGYFIFMEDALPETHFDLEVRASGYVPTKKRVLLEAPGIGPPLLRIEMIPQENPIGNTAYKTLSGTRKGLAAIDAARPEKNSCFARTFDARKRLLTVYNPYRIEFDRARYALIAPDGLSYESFAVESRVSDEAFTIDHPFVSTVSADLPIVPVVAGCVDAAGAYLLRVPDDGAGKGWIVRFTEETGERFEPVDFDGPKIAQLAEAPRKASEKGKKN
ncbi:MAG: hypothetical protein LBB57_02955 [Clostridiales Family XIII bacterium]|jgi:hypothetical protein|nr:hypothetical protein [Clostridiales Family XIII bacterium]